MKPYSDGDNDSDGAHDLFKCRVVMEGTDVFGGIRKMLEMGVAKSPLPDFIRDAQMMGSTNIDAGS